MNASFFLILILGCDVMVNLSPLVFLLLGAAESLMQFVDSVSAGSGDCMYFIIINMTEGQLHRNEEIKSSKILISESAWCNYIIYV